MSELNLENFIKFVKTNYDEFCRLDCAILEKYLSDDKLVVKDEKEAFDALQQWVMHSPKERFAEVPKLLPLIRLNQLDDDFLKKTVFEFAVEGNCAELAKSAIDRGNYPADQREDVEVDFSIKPRKSATHFTIVAVCTEEVMMGTALDTTIKVYSTKTMEWTELPVDTTIEKLKLGEGECTMYGKHHLLFFDQQSLTIQSLNLVTMKIDPLPKHFRNVHASTMEIVEDKLYFLGTDPLSIRNVFDLLRPHSATAIPITTIMKNLKSVALRFNFKTRQWSSIQPMSIPRSGFSSAVFNNKIYTAGGAPKSAVECFDPKTGRWTALAPTLWARCNATMAASDKYLYLFGGRGYSDVEHGAGAFKSVERYDPAINEWTIIAELSEFIYGFYAITILDRVYLVGGEDVSDKSIGQIVNKFREEAEVSKPYPIFDLKTEKFVDETIEEMPNNILWPVVGYYINE